MKAKLIDLDSPNIDMNIFMAKKGEAFSFPVDLEIGADDDESGEYFYMSFCSPESFAEPTAFHMHRFLRGFVLFHDGFSKEIALKYLNEMCESIEGETWEEVTSKLMRFCHYEYEEYNKDPLPH